MSWRDSLRPASWRGVAFEVEATSGTFWRRVARHEYPQRDIPAIEDMGRATRELTISAFIIGDRYMQRRDQLIAAAEKPGPGVLIHPYLGRMRVVCESFSLGETTTDGRMATLEFTFVEAGELTFPTGAALTKGKVESAADAVKAAAKTDFTNNFSLTKYLYLTKAAVDDLHHKLQHVEDALNAPGAAVADVVTIKEKTTALAASAATLFQTPATFVDDFQAILGAPDDFAAYDDILGDGTEGDTANANQTTPGEKQQEENRFALQRLYWRSSLAGAALALAGLDFTSYDDAIEVRDKIADRIATEAETGGSNESFEALTDLKTSVFEDITEKASTLAKLRTVTTNDGAALVMAYELYNDRERGDEIIERNKIPNGSAFAGSVRVLSS